MEAVPELPFGCRFCLKRFGRVQSRDGHEHGKHEALLRQAREVSTTYWSRRMRQAAAERLDPAEQEEGSGQEMPASASVQPEVKPEPAPTAPEDRAVVDVEALPDPKRRKSDGGKKLTCGAAKRRRYTPLEQRDALDALERVRKEFEKAGLFGALEEAVRVTGVPYTTLHRWSKKQEDKIREQAAMLRCTWSSTAIAMHHSFAQLSFSVVEEMPRRRKATCTIRELPCSSKTKAWLDTATCRQFLETEFVDYKKSLVFEKCRQHQRVLRAPRGNQRLATVNPSMPDGGPCGSNVWLQR